MAIRPIEFQGTIQRSNDFTTIKHNEDQKGVVNQSNFQLQEKKHIESNIKSVHDADDTNKKGDNTDAKEKGNGQFIDIRKKNQKQKPLEADGKVICKEKRGFDITI